MRSDKELLDWIEQQARKSSTGVAFDWAPSVEGEPSGFRFMRHHWLGQRMGSIRATINYAMGPEDEGNRPHWPEDIPPLR